MDHIHTFLTTQGHGGPLRMSDQLDARATSETAQTWKTIHTKHTLRHPNKANMEWWLRRSNDTRGPWGSKVSWHLSYRWGKTPKKPHPGNLSRPGIEPGPAAWQARMLPLAPQRRTITEVRRPIIIAAQNFTLSPANGWTSSKYRCCWCLLALLQNLRRLVSGLKPILVSSANMAFLHSAMVQCWWARAQFLRSPQFHWFSAELLIGLLKWSHPDAFFYALFGLRYASLLPGWIHIQYVWQFMLGACEPTVGSNDPALVLSNEDNQCKVCRSQFSSLCIGNSN